MRAFCARRIDREPFDRGVPMDRLRDLPQFQNVDDTVVDDFQSALDRIEVTVRDRGFTPDLLGELRDLLTLMPRMGTNQCHKGTGAPAPQWETTIHSTTYITCGHNPPHIQVKR